MKTPGCIIAWLLAGTVFLSARPAEIILLRHGEKPPNDHDPNLSPLGVARAEALPALLAHSLALLTNGPPAALFAPRSTPHGHGRRAEETILPSGKELRLRVRTSFVAADYKKLAQQILSDHALDGKTIVICWVHDFIPALAHELGVAHPPNWRGNEFDRTWVVTYDGPRAVLRNLPQHLLPGDSSE